MRTIWVFGDQLNRNLGALREADPRGTTVLLVESEAKLASKRWHAQRLHLVLSAMSHFAAELEAEGFDVDHRRAPTLAEGLRAHCDELDVDRVIAMDGLTLENIYIKTLSTDARAPIVLADVKNATVRGLRANGRNVEDREIIRH